MVESLAQYTSDFGVQMFGLKDQGHGIVHVVGPEQGISQPGMIVVCADSHTSTHGAAGALAFGLGMTEANHILATQTLWQRMPKMMRISVDGRLGAGVCAKFGVDGRLWRKGKYEGAVGGRSFADNLQPQGFAQTSEGFRSEREDRAYGVHDQMVVKQRQTRKLSELPPNGELPRGDLTIDKHELHALRLMVETPDFHRPRKPQLGPAAHRVSVTFFKWGGWSGSRPRRPAVASAAR